MGPLCELELAICIADDLLRNGKEKVKQKTVVVGWSKGATTTNPENSEKHSHLEGTAQMTEVEEAKMRELLRATEREIHLMFMELFEWARKTELSPGRRVQNRLKEEDRSTLKETY